jgi:hypothetical protein
LGRRSGFRQSRTDSASKATTPSKGFVGGDRPDVPTAGCPCGGDDRQVAVDRGAEHGPAVVVEVIAEQLDPARGGRHPVRSPIRAEGEASGDERALLDFGGSRVRLGARHVRTLL